MEQSKELNCPVCHKPVTIHHATTWGVAGRLLGCCTYTQCSACTNQDAQSIERCTLSPCNEKHVKVLNNPLSL